MVAGYKKSITEKTEEFYQDVAMGHYAPNWSIVTKFGRNPTVANGAWELIANLSVIYTWPQAPTTVRVKAGGNPADTIDGVGARTLRIYGIDSTATKFIYEDVELAGASASASTTQEFWRVHRGIVQTAGSYVNPTNTGTITVEDTAGTANLLQIDPLESQTQLLAYSLPTGISANLLGFESHVEATKPANIRILYRPNFTNVTVPVDSTRMIFFEAGVDGGTQNLPPAPMDRLDGPCDLWIEAYGSGAQTAVSGAFQLFQYPTPT